MADLTLNDLAGGESAGKAAAEAGKQAAEQASGKGTGEWFLELYDRLEQDGMLMPILFGDDAIASPAEGPKQDAAPENPEMFSNDDSETDETEAEEAENGVTELNAESIAGICEGIENSIGDVRISQIRAMCENRPEQVNGMIEQHL